jgi:uncharacterized protein (TIGR02001 family)
MKTYLTLSAIALAAAATLSSGVVMAADPAPAATPDFVVTGNFGITSDYRFRGLSQNNQDPSFQGGFDVAHSSGLYIGTWGSNVSAWTAGSKGNLELDLYGGYKTEVAGIGFDVGAIAYKYPGSEKSYGANTQEAYVGLAYGPAVFKTSYVLSKHYFATLGTAGPGTADSAKGTFYYDLTVSQEVLPKLTASVHAGYTDFKAKTAYDNDASVGKLSYADYNVGLAYDLNGYVFGVKYYYNDVKAGTKYYAGPTASGANGTKIYKNGVAVSLTKAF